MLGVCQTVKTVDGVRMINGRPQSPDNDLKPVGEIWNLAGDQSATGPIGPLEYITTLSDSEIITWGSEKLTDDDGQPITIYYPQIKKGADLLVPGGSPTFAGIRSDNLVNKLDFISLMLALFAIPTAILMHGFWKETDAQAKMMEQVQFMKDMALGGAAIMGLAAVWMLGSDLGLTITDPLFNP